MSGRPVPTKSDVLNRLKGKVPISCIVDVGVRECTAELMSGFGDIKHYLFEPASEFFPQIERNYGEIQYELFPLALSNENSRIFLILTCLHNDGVPTHSQISPEAVPVDGLSVVSCEPITVARFADLPVAQEVPENFLLKVDVDGKDLEVVEGFGQYIKKASVIVIESTYSALLDRLGYIQSQGFQLLDIVDLVYYGDGLWQFDLVCIRPDLINSVIRPSIIDFKNDLWAPLLV